VEIEIRHGIAEQIGLALEANKGYSMTHPV
jgi:hypothetical protein